MTNKTILESRINGFLCMASSDGDPPITALVPTFTDLQRFIEEYWFGEKPSEMSPDNLDWYDRECARIKRDLGSDGECHIDLEDGWVSFRAILYARQPEQAAEQPEKEGERDAGPCSFCLMVPANREVVKAPNKAHDIFICERCADACKAAFSAHHPDSGECLDPLEMKLTGEVTIGHTKFGKGVRLKSLVLYAQCLHAEYTKNLPPPTAEELYLLSRITAPKDQRS